MSEWISVDDKSISGDCIVYLEKDHLGSRYATSVKMGNVRLVGGNFHFDMPKITHWMPLPEPPKTKAP